MVVQQKPKLIQPIKEGCAIVQFYVADSELFDILHKTHVSIGHEGRDRLIKALSPKFKNITRHDIELFLQLCTPCQQKRKGCKKGIVVKQIISSELNSRCKVDLTDFQSHPDEDKKIILVYQDHLTKFVVLKALKTKRAEEVAYNLIDIFTLTEAPSVLQSDNGREFSNQIFSNLKDYWPQVHIVHGKLRHSRSQGSVERANQDVENMLTTWMQDENSSHWSIGLRFVQLMKDRAYHAGIKMSPYEALFGYKVKLALNASNLPHEVLKGIVSEEELQEIATSVEEPDTHDQEEEVYEALTSAPAQTSAAPTPPTSIAAQPSAAPKSTPAQLFAAPTPPISTPAQLFAAPTPPISTPAQPSAALTPSTSAPAQPSAAPTPPTSTAAQPSAAPTPSTSAPAQPSAAPTPPTSTAAHPSAATTPSTSAPAQPSAATIPPTSTAAQPFAAPTPPTTTPAQPSAAPTLPTSAPAQPSATPTLSTSRTSHLQQVNHLQHLHLLHLHQIKYLHVHLLRYKISYVVCAPKL